MTEARHPMESKESPGTQQGTPSKRTRASVQTQSSTKRTASKRITTNLVALSSVAILSVYGIGYARTQSSADALTSPGNAGALPPNQSVAAPPNPFPVAKARPTAPPLPTATTASPATARAPGNPSGTKPAGQLGPTGPTALPTASADAGAMAGSTPDPTTPPVSPTAVVAVAPATSTAVPARAPAPPSPTSSPTPSVRSLRDGTYKGDGFSRHGDIEATVVVAGGKVISANVTACGTRYSCRLVTPLVSEVVSNQTAPIDLISGATDSSHAYRDAIIKALSQAT